MSIVGQATGRDDTVDVGMVDQSLTPGVEDEDKAEAGAEVAGVDGDVLKRPGRRAQQEVVDDLRALEGERCESLGQREDDVGIGHRQHLGLASVEPAGLGAALTLGAMTVPARVVGDHLVPARVALVDVTAEARGPARQDLVDDPVLLPTPRA